MIKVKFTKGWAHVFKNSGLESFDDFFNYSTGRVINKNKKRDVVEMTLTVDGEQKEFFMKRFYKPHFKDTLFTLRNFGSFCTQAQLEYKNANLLLQNNIGTYYPACFGKNTCLFLEKASFLVTEKIRGQVLTDYVNNNFEKISDSQKTKLMTALGKFIRKIHDANFSMPDLYLWHIFITNPPAETDDYDFAIIDLHRMSLNATKAEKIKNLGAFDFSMSEKYFSESLRQALLDAYTEGTKINKETLRAKIKKRSNVLKNRRRRPDY